MFLASSKHWHIKISAPTKVQLCLIQFSLKRVPSLTRSPLSLSLSLPVPFSDLFNFFTSLSPSQLFNFLPLSPQLITHPIFRLPHHKFPNIKSLKYVISFFPHNLQLRFSVPTQAQACPAFPLPQFHNLCPILFKPFLSIQASSS